MSLLPLEDLPIRVLTHITFVARRPGDILDSDILREAVLRAEVVEPWRTTSMREGKPSPSLMSYSFPVSRAKEKCGTDPATVVETCMFTLEAGEMLPVTRLSAYVKSVNSLGKRMAASLPPGICLVRFSFTFIVGCSEVITGPISGEGEV
jgi:hypothetical protein